MDTNTNGWEYISAIFKMLLERTEDHDIIEPQYIYRGITRRYFSRSEKNEQLLQLRGEIAKTDKDKDIRKKSENLYKQEQYPAALKVWEDIDRQDYKPAKALKALMTSPEYRAVVPEFIKSGAAVRLQEQSVSNSPHVEYVNYIKHMINDIKDRFPKYVDEDYSDIEILADIQHKGAASCLVDFSNNFLTSLWFATQGDDKDLGYLFCYDINNALIGSDRLTILDPQRSNRSITELLYETTKTTKCSGKQEYRFWLWKPSNLNERIARQDSIFIFGLEAFKIKDHHIVTIPVPPTWKKPIQHALKAFFGITAESIYCDIDGYADANSKTQPYEKTTLRYYSNSYNVRKTQEEENPLDVMQSGMSCLFQCEYELALKYFTLYESKIKNVPREHSDIFNGDILYPELKSLTLDIELHFSKAVCLNHLGEPFGAINEYSAVLRDYKLINKLETSIEKSGSKKDKAQLGKYRGYFLNKYYKTVNDLMEMYYDTKQYDKVISTFKNQLDYAEKHSDNSDEAICNIRILQETVCREVMCLKALDAFIQNSKTSTSGKTKPIDFELGNCIYVDANSQPFYHVLNQYFACIMSILKSEKLNLERNIFAFEECISSYHRNQFVVDIFYPKWNMKDLKEFIVQIKDIDIEKYHNLMAVTALLNDFANFIQGKVKIEPW